MEQAGQIERIQTRSASPALYSRSPTTIDHAPASARLLGLSRSINGSPAVQRLQSVSASIQRKAVDEEELVQKQSSSPVQRRVTIKHQPIGSIVNYLDHDDWLELVSLGEAETAGWMLGLNHLWNFSGPEDLILFVNRAASMTKLIRSIFGTGILSRTELTRRNMDYVGSEDRTSGGGLAVNILDNRQTGKNSRKITDESMVATNRGSISVALERKDDWVKDRPTSDTPHGEWTGPEDIPITEQDMQEFERLAPGNAKYLVNPKKEERAYERNSLLLNTLYQPEMQDRAQNTIMALVPNPDQRDYGLLGARDDSYESEVASGQIRPGAGGFQSLLIPQWFEPFYLMLRDIQPPQVTVHFVGSRQVTAQYKNPLGHIPVTVNAPDYASEVTTQLEKFRLIATHILTA